MCGIAGFSFSAESCLNARELSRALLLSIQERGREATGYAHFDSTGAILDNNQDSAASKFVKSRLFALDAAARTVILHTRFATKGTVKNPLNNHPINAYDATGSKVAAVHNGGVWNDDEKFTEHGLPRLAQVDSEIIPAMITEYGSDAYPMIFNELEGGIATAWLDERIPGTLHCVRACDSPMYVVHIDNATAVSGLPLTGLIFASTVKALGEGLRSLGLTWATPGVLQYNIDEGQQFTVTDGLWDVTVYNFELPEMVSRWGGGYRAKNASTQGNKGGAVYGSYSEGYDSWTGDTWVGGGSTIIPGDATTEPTDAELEMEAEVAELAAQLNYDDFDAAQAAIKAHHDAEAGYAAGTALPTGVQNMFTRGDLLHDLVERLANPYQAATSFDTALVATLTAEEIDVYGIDANMILSSHADVMIHSECCQTNECRFGWEFCPVGLDGYSALALAALKVVTTKWDLAVADLNLATV